jgi:N-methylhydantoinase A
MRIGVDVGGTFTDLVAIGPRGLTVAKVPSTPDAPERGIWDAYDEAALAAPPGALVHGTTVATNALLERKGARVVLVVTAGFEDLLELRRQGRASLYDLAAHHPPPLVPRDRVVGVDERMGPAGVVRPLSDATIERVVRDVQVLQPEAVAVSLLFGFLHPAHERRLAAALRSALPHVPVVVAHESVPRVREYERTSTLVAEAFLRPRVGAYVTRFAADASGRGIATPRVLASNGGALDPVLAAEHATWLALSGPAGGIQGAALVGREAGAEDLLTLDMGGTSADAGVVLGGAARIQASGSIAGIPLSVPHLAIETVSAGGGSLAWLDDGGALRVGPESAGAVPGPACYGRGGGRPTVTDAFVALGWIPDGTVLGGHVPVRRQRALEALGPLAAAAGLDVPALALGIVQVAEAAMARALRRVSVERGLDPSQLTFVAFGGAGPLCACDLAALLGVRRVLLPPHAGVLSALGMAAARDVVEVSRAVHLESNTFAAVAPALAQDLSARLAAALPAGAVSFVAECRYVGQGYELDVPCEAGAWADVAGRFHRVHQAAYGHADPAAAVEVVELRGIARGGDPIGRIAWRRRDTKGGTDRLRLRFPQGTLDAAGYDWEALVAGQRLAAPALVVGSSATAILPPGWSGRVTEIGAIIVEPGDARPD